MPRSKAFSQSPRPFPSGADPTDCQSPMNSGYVSNLSDWRDSDVSKKYCESPVLRQQMNVMRENYNKEQTVDDIGHIETLTYILNNK